MNNLRWIGHANTLFDMQRSLHENMESCEITLVAKGYSVRAHRFVLSSCSDLLRALLDNVPIGQEASILVPDIKGTLLDSVISFVYLGETSLSSINLTEFLEAINLLGIKSAISFECNTTAFTATHHQQPQQQQPQQQQSHQQQQQQQQQTQLQHQQTNTNIQQTNINSNATIKTIGDIQIIHEELIDSDTKIGNHQVLNEDDVNENTRQLEFLDVYGGGNAPGNGGATGSGTVTGGVVGNDDTQQHKITYSIEQMAAPTNNSNDYIITENTFTLTHQNTKLENASSATSSSCCDKLDDDVDEVITEDSIDPDMTTDADIIEDFDDVNDPLLEMNNVNAQQQPHQQQHHSHHNNNNNHNARTNAANVSSINVPNNRHAHNKPARVKVQVKWKQQQQQLQPQQQQQQRMPLQQQQPSQHHNHHQQHQTHHQQQQQQPHQQQHQQEVHDLELQDDEDDDDEDEDYDNDDDQDQDDEELDEGKHDNSNYHNDCKDYEIDDVDVDDVDNLSYKLESNDDNKNILIVDPISVKGEISGTTHEHSINLAVQAVINEGISLQKAAHKYNISKTVLWRRVRKHPNYMKTSRENPVLKLAYERLKEGDSLKNISRDLDIPMSTLHRHKVRLAQEGRLPKYTAFKKRGSMSKDELKEKLSKAVYACVHDGMSQNKSANLFDIPKSTLWRHLQKRVAEAELLQKNNSLEIKEEIILS